MSTTREIAEQITIEVAKVCGCNWESCTSVRTATTDAIDKALQAEREPGHLRRLQSAVVRQAKVFTSNEEARDNWNALVAYRELCGAVDALIAFEAENGIGEK